MKHLLLCSYAWHYIYSLYEIFRAATELVCLQVICGYSSSSPKNRKAVAWEMCIREESERRT